jgi:RimJ/RimL family protein N-acetyltransferase
MSSSPAGADLATERVTAGGYTLRPWEAADVAWVYDACQDADIQRFTDIPKPYRPADALALLDLSRRGRNDGTGYAFAICRTDNDELLGAIDLRDVADGVSGKIGYWVTSGARGEGVATAALGALARWGFERLGLREVHVIVAATNAASRRVAERAGFRVEAGASTECPDGDDRVAGVAYVRRREGVTTETAQ